MAAEAEGEIFAREEMIRMFAAMVTARYDRPIGELLSSYATGWVPEDFPNCREAYSAWIGDDSRRVVVRVWQENRQPRDVRDNVILGSLYTDNEAALSFGSDVQDLIEHLGIELHDLPKR